MYLEQEIHEQADVLARLLREETATAEAIGAAARAADPAFVLIAARGTSDNAARYAQYLLGAYARLPVALSTPSLHTLYERPPVLGRALAIGISQSGKAEDVRRVLADARAQGALTLAITNDPSSPMAHTAAHHLLLHAGEEISVAATKTYTAELAAIAMLCAGITGDESLAQGLAILPGAMREALALAGDIPGWAERYRYMTQFAVIGRGYNYATAFEIALKIKELTYVIGEGYSEADFLHGPIATVAAGFPVIAVAPQGATLGRMRELIAKVNGRGAEVIVISNDSETRAMGQKAVAIPDAPEWLSPLLAVVPGQVFAMQQALVRGYAVDRPRGLSKVTVTE
jgi:glutamine---fructose-6-phosphate transaminase (isomerizing)